MQKGRLMMHGEAAAVNNGLRSPPSSQYDTSNLGIVALAQAQSKELNIRKARNRYN